MPRPIAQNLEEEMHWEQASAAAAAMLSEFGQDSLQVRAQNQARVRAADPQRRQGAGLRFEDALIPAARAARYALGGGGAFVL
jgi:hypothetical protein